MTRVLSELLGAPAASLRLGLNQLEQSTGRPSADIRLSVDVGRRTKEKVHALGLDPSNTTGEELYAALGQRLREDEERFAAALQRHAVSGDDAIAHVAIALSQFITPKQCYALKTAVVKRLLKSNVPKKAMKALGYRSVDSMLKHETSACLLAVAWMLETEAWTKKLHAAYAKLKASDFELRDIAIEHPTSARWQKLAGTVVAQKQHHILTFRELGAVVLLPLPDERPDMATLSTAILALHAINDIHAATTFLRLHQVQPNFGAVVRKTASGDFGLQASLLDQPVSWSLVQRYFARFGTQFGAAVFEPLVQAEDFVWQGIEHVLASIEPGMEFWQGSHNLALLSKGTPVSCNLTDAVLSHSNGLPYQSRIVRHFRHELRAELSMQYMLHERLQQSIVGTIHKQLAYEPASA